MTRAAAERTAPSDDDGRADAGRSRVRGRRPAQGEPVIDRALSLLAAFDAEHTALGVSELTARSGIPKSSTIRLAARLTAWGALERRTDGQFVIGLRLWKTGALSPRGHLMQQVAMPYMGDLAQVTRQHVLLAALDGDAAVLVERMSAHDAAPVLYAIGDRLPLHSTGVGLALLAFAPAATQQDYLDRPLVHEPENNPVEIDDLRRRLAEVRREGFAVVHRAAFSVISVAAPIFGANEQITGALSVVLPPRDVEPRLLGPAVRTAARGVSRELGARRSIGAGTVTSGPR